MSEFTENMADAFAEALETAGEPCFIDGKEITGIPDEAETSYGNVPGGMATRVTMKVHVKKEDFDAINGKKAAKIEIPSMNVAGRIDTITPYHAAHYTLTISNPNAIKER